jgi:hypothetical protein
MVDSRPINRTIRHCIGLQSVTRASSAHRARACCSTSDILAKSASLRREQS